MKLSEHKNKKIIIALLLISAIALGAILAKVLPLDSSKGLSALLANNSTKNSDKITSTETTTSSQAESSEEPKPLSYVEQVNQEISEGKFANRMKIKLLLQTDDRWKATEYGTGNSDGNTIENNGCAILSLTMIAEYLDEAEYVPQVILDWSKNDYYLEGQGTAWGIFSDFALMKGYQFQDLGMDMVTVEEHLKQGHPVIVSVKPGTFTETGHIMVLTGTNNGNVWLNDPNDSEEKGHSIKEFSINDIANESVNFWVMYK